MPSSTSIPAGTLPLRLWLAGMRPKTLTMSAVPVLVGSFLAWSNGTDPLWWVFGATLACAALIQVGTNLLNDASDGARGGDGPGRLGPLRLTGSGLASASQVRQAALRCFGLALLLGIYLVLQGGWVIFTMGIASLAAGYAYSGGPKPLSHTSWGEAFVVLFFGVVAVAGSFYLQSKPLPIFEVIAAGLAVGCHAAAVLLVNNVRDLEADRLAGRNTLAQRLGLPASRTLYTVLMLAPFVLLTGIFEPVQMAVICIAVPVCAILSWKFVKSVPGPNLNTQLVHTALAQALLGALICVAAML